MRRRRTTAYAQKAGRGNFMRRRRTTAYAQKGAEDIVGKGDKERHVLLGESSSQVLLPLRGDANADMPGFQSRQEVARDGHYKGACLDTTTIFRIVREAAKRAGVPNWNEVSPHWLRHCHGSHAIDRKAPLTVVRDTLVAISL